ncbi:MAG: hypothetical protein K0U41_03410 [Gammaproteobacteria bacterium]|nr:hypothetical protein [Gammaproteobacteria bacterium]
MRIKNILKKLLEWIVSLGVWSRRKFWGLIMLGMRKTISILKKPTIWILWLLLIIVILVILIVVKRYFLYTPITITGNNVTIDGVNFAMDSINCIKAWNFWQPFLFRTDIPKDIACLPELKFWKRLSDPYEPLNIRNVF